MKCVQLLLACWCCCSSLLPVINSINVTIESYSCVTDYWSTITCTLKITSNHVERTKPRYWMKFKSVFTWNPGNNYSCPLVEINQTYKCSIKDNRNVIAFSDDDIYSVMVCLESDCTSVTEEFSPAHNIQPKPPYGIEVQWTPETFNITWKTGYENHIYLWNQLEYELSLQTSETNKTLQQVMPLASLRLNQVLELKQGAACCVKVRSIPGSEYKGTWSKWSLPRCWKSEATEEQEPILVILIKSLSPLCVVVGAVIFVFYSPAARLKIRSLSHTPSPAPFFGSLFKKYDGNLQEWLSPQHSVVMKPKPEEILPAATMIVEPKANKKEPEENEALQKPSVTQLLFSQCQTSYVSLPVMQETSPLPSGVFPVDMPYTQLPCSTWGFSVEEAADTRPSSTYFLDNSCDDSAAVRS